MWHARYERPDSADLFIAEASAVLDRNFDIDQRWIDAHTARYRAFAERDRIVEAAAVERRVLERLTDQGLAPEWIARSYLRLGYALFLAEQHQAALEVLDEGEGLARDVLSGTNPLIEALAELRRSVDEDLSAR